MSRARAMLSRRRALLYAALALAIPLPALALTGGGSGGLTVEASLGGCGVAPGGIVCEINASWNEVEGAEYYTASVAAPDGSVTDAGDVGAGGGTSLWVPYVGNGTYSVTVSAWGVEESGEPEVLDTAEAETTGKSGELKSGDAKQVGEGAYGVPDGEQPSEPEASEPPAEGAEPTCDATELPVEPPAGEEQAHEGGQAAEQADPAADATTEAAPTTEATDPACPPSAAPRTP